jgi:hypothetical protein
MLLDRDGQAMLAISLRLAPENAALKSGGCPGTGTMKEMNYQPHFLAGFDQCRCSQVQAG